MSTKADDDAMQPIWPKPVILGSLAVVGVSLVVAILYPRARAAIAAAVIISPIPPVP